MRPLHEPTIELDGVLRPTYVEVDLDRLAANYAAIKQHVAPAKVMCVLKANAYGHGLVPVARLWEELGADYLGLAYLEEGMRLRRAGVRTPILILGGILWSQLPLFIQNDLTVTASSTEKLLAIEAVARDLGKRARVHLKIDTGMERIGVHWYSASQLLETSLRCEWVDVEGIFSHFANSDAADLSHARLQLERFAEVVASYEAHAKGPLVRHMANSGGVLQLPESHLDMVRPGIMLYGVLPSEQCQRTVPVKPALCWKSRVVFFKVVQAGNPVSYGSTYTPLENTRMVTVPVGYGDGYFRAMSGQAEVCIRGKRYPTRGRICMDQVMVDLGAQGEAYNTDEVVLLGEQGDVAVSAEDLARWAGTIPYEVLTNINTRVPRVYVGEWAARLNLADEDAR